MKQVCEIRLFVERQLVCYLISHIFILIFKISIWKSKILGGRERNMLKKMRTWRNGKKAGLNGFLL